MTTPSFMRQVLLFSDLPIEDLDKLARVSTRRTYPRDSVIFFEDDEGDALFIINRGRVKVAKFSGEGKEFILAILGTGDFFGDMSLLDGKPRSATVVAIDDTDVSIIRRTDFISLVRENPQMGIKLMEALSLRLRETNRKIGNLALLDVYGRLARILMDFAKLEGRRLEDGRIAFRRPTHQAIANMIGTSRETVTRTLGDLHRRGYIRLKGKEIIIKGLFERDFDNLIS
jgi:CRP/FNR family cyclic AMP-dependent transcriptional regulator